MGLPRAFNHLTVSNLAAQSAEQLALVATPMAAVLLLQAGPGQVGLLAMAQSLPFLLLSIPLGLMADRRPRRAIMAWAEVARAASLLVLLAAMLAGQVNLSLLMAMGLVGAIGTVAYSVAAPSLVPALVPSSQLTEANRRLELARSVAFAAGPAVGGALVSGIGAPSAFALAALLSAIAVWQLRQIREPARAPLPVRRPWAELSAGARQVWRHALLRPILVTSIVWNMAWFVLQASYVPYAIGRLGLDAAAVGLTLSAYGLGMVVGALLCHRVIQAMPFGRAVQLGPLVSVLAMSALVATLLWPSAWLAGLGFFLFGASPILWTITSTTLRQSVTPPAMLGRVSAIFLTVNTGARPLGAALGGAVGSVWGEAACLWLALAGFCIQALLILAPAVHRLHALPASD